MVGIDIENVERFKNLDTHLIERVYTKQEINYCVSRAKSYIHFAGIWCAKEAVVKALAGLSLAVSEVEILHHSNGAPYVNITPKIEEYLYNQNVQKINISISHTDTIAAAIAILTR